MEEGQNANKNIVKDSEGNQEGVDENRKESEEYQDAANENENYYKELTVLLARLEYLKQIATEFAESAETSSESFKAAKIYFGSLYEALEKLKNSHKSKLKKVKRYIHAANKEIDLLKNGLL